MGQVTILFSRKRLPGSVILRAWMHSRFSHCAFVDTATGTVIEAVPGGVREYPLADTLNGASYYEIVQFPSNDPSLVLALAREQIGKPYDWKGVLGFWLRRNWQDDSAFMCSELLAWAFAEAGEPLFRREAHRISPETLYLPFFIR